MDRNLAHMANEVFPEEPDRIALYPAAAQQRVLAALLQDVAAGSHLLCLNGPEGSGKTVLLRALRQDMKQGLVGAIEQPAQGRLLFEVAKAFQLDVEDANESTLRRRLVMLLSMADRQHQPIVLIVDAAETLTTEDIDLLLHFFPPDHASLVLAGRSAPETWLAGCSSAPDAVHIDRSYRLEPLSAEETAGYIRHRLRIAGLPENLFPPATLTKIHRDSGGIPGRINQFSTDALAHASVRREQGGSSIAPETVPEAGMSSDTPQATAEGSLTSDGTTAETVRERRRSAEALARPVVAPREARYASAHQPSRTRRLRRSVRIWRTLAMLAIVVLALDLTRDIWRDHLPTDLALLERLAVPTSQPAGPVPSAQEPARPGASDGDADPTTPANGPGASSDFAALHAPSLLHDTSEAPQAPDATPGTGAAHSESTSALAPTPEPARESVPQPSVDASEQNAETASEAADIGRKESASETSAEPASAPEPGSVPRDEPQDTAKADRKAASVDSAGSGSARESPRLTRSQRREVARLYAERAEYEWRNGELAAAAASVRRGLSTDPHNPRLLHMRAMLRQITQQP